MSFRFESLQAFLWMEGHGPYVWGCYAVVFLTLLFLAFEPHIQRKRFIKEQRALARRQAGAQQEE